MISRTVREVCSYRRLGEGDVLSQRRFHRRARARLAGIVHAVEIDPASRLATILGTEAMGVNSMHHQVIDRLGPGVRAVAHNHDGHIEAIEIETAPAVLGVQWHPELMRHRGDHLALFEDLVRQVVSRRSD